MEIRYTQRNFQYIHHDPYVSNGDDGLIVQSSAINTSYSDSFQRPGSSYLWIKGLFHLNREEIEEMIGYLGTWLKTGKFDQAHEPELIPKESLKIGDKIQVSAACWTGYRSLTNIGRAKIVASPPGPWSPEHRCLFRTSFDGKMNGIFVGWSYLLVGVRNVADLMDSKWDNTFIEHDRIKVARWQPRGTQYLRPRAALPEDIEHVMEVS